MSFYPFEDPRGIVMHPRLPKLRYMSSFPPGSALNPHQVSVEGESKSSTNSFPFQYHFNTTDASFWNSTTPILSNSQIAPSTLQNSDIPEPAADDGDQEQHNERGLQASKSHDEDGNSSSNVQQETEAESGQKRKRRSRRNVKKASTSDDEYKDQEVTAPMTSTSKKRQKPRAKSSRASKKDTSIPAKIASRPSTRLIRKKPTGIPLPKSLDEAGEPDKMMWRWKNSGKNWDDIRKEWQRMTGHLPGHSTLSVRYIKLNENLAKGGAANDHDLCRFKKEAEQELLAQLWDRVAEKMLEHNAGSEHNPRELSKRYNMLVRSGFDPDAMARMERDALEEKNMIPAATDVHNMFAGGETAGEDGQACSTDTRAAEAEANDNYSIESFHSYAKDYDHDFGAAGFTGGESSKHGIIKHHLQSCRPLHPHLLNESIITYPGPLVEYSSDGD